MRSTLTAFLILVVTSFVVSCMHTAEVPPTPPKPVATPSKNFTSADLAKLKWIEGSWKSMDGDKPFFERYKVEDNALVVETLLEDGSLDGPAERFELKNGELGKGEGDKRSAATEITDSYIQFVPVGTGTRNSFRFEKQSDGTWIALLEFPANGDKPAGKKVYKMEPWQVPKK